VSIPLPAASKLIPDLGSLSSFTSVIKNQIVIAPREEGQVGEYKISFLKIDKNGKATRVDTQLKVKVLSNSTLNESLLPFNEKESILNKIKVRIALKSINSRGQVIILTSTKVPGFLQQVNNQSFSAHIERGDSLIPLSFEVSRVRQNEVVI
jgi:hypothetical protein